MSQENMPSIKNGETEVLFQKLGGKWYVFSQIEKSLFTPLPKELIQDLQNLSYLILLKSTSMSSLLLQRDCLMGAPKYSEKPQVNSRDEASDKEEEEIAEKSII